MQIRIEFQKIDTASFLSHLEMQQVWQRSLRRAEIPVAVSEGYNPHPKLSFGSALPVGVSSYEEYLDVELYKAVDLEGIKEKINSCLPPGFKVLRVEKITKKVKSLMAVINRAEYNIEQKIASECPENISGLIKEYLHQDTILIERKTKSGIKEKDISKGIFYIEGSCNNNILNLKILVQTGSQGNVKPDEVLNTFLRYADLKKADIAKVTRNHLFVAKGDELLTPFDVLEG